MKIGSIFRDHSFWVIAFFILIFTSTVPGSASDQTRMAFIESVLSRHEVWIDRSPYLNMFDSMWKDGHLISDKPYLLSIYSVIVLFPVHLFIKFDSEVSKAILYYIATLFVSGLPILVMLHYIKRIHFLMGGAGLYSNTTAFCVVLGTPILPFVTKYNNHVMEAVLILAAFYHLLNFRMNREAKSGWICGALSGVGLLVQIVAPFIFAALTFLYFLLQSRLNAVKFMITVITLVLAGMGINYAFHRDVRPQYFMQEYYYHPRSAALVQPTTPRMSYEQLKNRLIATGVSERATQRTLETYVKYQQGFKNPLIYAKDLWLKYDFLVFLNPIFFLAALTLLGSVWRGGPPFLLEYLWVLAGTLMLYGALIFIRGVPGICFGNRYLIPILPAVVCFVAMKLKSGSPMVCWVQASGILSFAIMFQGVAWPWNIPNEAFRQMNLILCSVWAILCVMVQAFASIRGAANVFLKNLFVYRPTLCAVVLGLVLFEFWAYNGMRDWGGLWNSLRYYQVFVLKFMVWLAVSAGFILFTKKRFLEVI